MDERKMRGARGEEIAAAFLEARGFRVIAKNWMHRLGEIDLIVERNGEVRFIEVKLRYTRTFGYPEASITGAKLRHLARAIECWLQVQARPPKRYQADAVAITLIPGQKSEIHWIEAIFV